MTDSMLLPSGDLANLLAHDRPTLVHATRRPELALSRPTAGNGGVQ